MDATPTDLANHTISDLTDALAGEWEMWAEQGVERLSYEDFESLLDLRGLQDAIDTAREEMPGYDPAHPLQGLIDWLTGADQTATPWIVRKRFDDPWEQIPTAVASLIATYTEEDGE